MKIARHVEKDDEFKCFGIFVYGGLFRRVFAHASGNKYDLFLSYLLGTRQCALSYRVKISNPLW